MGVLLRHGPAQGFKRGHSSFSFITLTHSALTDRLCNLSIADSCSVSASYIVAVIQNKHSLPQLTRTGQPRDIPQLKLTDTGRTGNPGP